MKSYIFDMDETFCDSIKKDHKNYFLDNLIPNKKMIGLINQLYDKGNRIVIMTGRGTMTGIDWKEETEKQLKVWGVKYHELKFMKKPLEYLYVDDKACNPTEFMEMMKDS
jgi:hypothetical protein